MATFEYASESERQVGPVTEIVRLTRNRITVSYRDPELCLTPELTAKLQAFWAERIEEMAYKVMTGSPAPARELPPGTFWRTPLVGLDPAEASQEAVQEPLPVPAATAPPKPQ